MGRDKREQEIGDRTQDTGYRDHGARGTALGGGVVERETWVKREKVRFRGVVREIGDLLSNVYTLG